MIKFGPSGFCEEFSLTNKSTEEMPKWLLNHNLKCYELSFTNGVRLSFETAEKYGKLFSDANIEVSVHAPYYINFANPDPLMIEKSNGYIIESLKRMEKLGATKLIFHPGTQMKMTRDEAFNNTYNNIKNLINVLDEQGFKNYILCPETMGKHGQIGTVEEIAKICTIDERIIPTIDFGHVNSFNQGSLKTEEDFAKIFETFKSYLGDRFNKVHIHFSKIEYGKKGEIKHLTFDDSVYGPEFEPLAKVLKKYNVEACVISESAGTQTKDACTMQNIYHSV
ncbi:MAG: TIM barrel protein [Clostridia bacterium]|nr:TIM barrel protein [Clostridia bacterium]